jgi:1-acyl-sn-glycerol-3-phosphate acyltransferase
MRLLNGGKLNEINQKHHKGMSWIKNHHEFPIWAASFPSLGERWRAFQIATKIFAMTALSPRPPDVQEARKEMGGLWGRYIDYLKGKWISVELEGFENVDWDTIHLVLGNHQAFWLEAHIIHHLVPDATVMMKDGLLTTPWIGPVIASTGPLIFDRSENQKTALRNTQEQQVTVLEKWWRLVVFPEGTRLKDPWQLILPWSPPLYSKAYECIKTRWEQQVAIITTNSMRVMPCTMEQSLLWKWHARKGVVRIHLDLVHADVVVKQFNDKAMEIVKGNLSRSE